MRIIQSAWACNQSNILTSNSGWLSPEYNLMSWTLSCLQLKQFYPEVVLYCDNVYAEMLIDNLQLPYTDVICNLDDLNKYHPQLWALPKIYTYSQQEKPFLHVDGDVFIWKEFSDQLLNGDLIAQNIETATDYYQKIMTSLELGLSYFPNELVEERKAKMPILAYNAGILGGSDISFFKEYTKKAFEFVDNNQLNLSKINVTNFNIFFEQYLFYCLAKKNKKNVNVLITEPIEDNQYKGFGDFVKVPYEKDYLHLLGAYKRNEFVCKQMADRLRQDFPQYYYKIIEIMKRNNVPIHKDYYHHLKKCKQETLIKRYSFLKKSFLTEQNSKYDKTEESYFNKDIDIFYFIERDQFLKLNVEQLKDIELFVSKINQINNTKFSFISKDFLYGRNCNSNYYYEYLFENKETIYSKKIIADSTFEIIESHYDWCCLREENKKGIASTILNSERMSISTVVIPECDSDGFNLSTIDNLDILILEILESAKTIAELLEEIKDYFNQDELIKSLNEFEKLIFGRIKIGLQSKTIKVEY